MSALPGANAANAPQCAHALAEQVKQVLRMSSLPPAFLADRKHGDSTVVEPHSFFQAVAMAASSLHAEIVQALAGPVFQHGQAALASIGDCGARDRVEPADGDLTAGVD
jgi:hypothetical protein